MNTLGLGGPFPPRASEEQVRKALVEAVRSRRLLENEDFQWWVKRLRGGLKKHYRKLVTEEEDPSKYHKRRGKIAGIELALKELRFRSKQVEELEERLKLYAGNEEPVARGA